MGALVSASSPTPLVPTTFWVALGYLRLHLSDRLFFYLQCNKGLKSPHIEIRMKLEHKLAKDLKTSLDPLAFGLIIGML